MSEKKSLIERVKEAHDRRTPEEKTRILYLAGITDKEGNFLEELACRRNLEPTLGGSMVVLNEMGAVFHLEEKDAMPKRYSVEQLASEPMFFAASPEYARVHGGVITRNALDALFHIEAFQKQFAEHVINGEYELVVDTRVNMLMEGMFPSIPGWHCDEVPRGENGQPDFSLCDPNVRHWMVVVDNGGDVSMTEFVQGRVQFEKADSLNVYKDLHGDVQEMVPDVIKARSGCFIEFDQFSVHRATQAVGNGWRFFFRASITKSRPVLNKDRVQVQSYILAEDTGW